MLDTIKLGTRNDFGNRGEKAKSIGSSEILAQNLGHIFAKPKDPITKEQRTDAIYSIPYNDCNHEY